MNRRKLMHYFKKTHESNKDSRKTGKKKLKKKRQESAYNKQNKFLVILFLSLRLDLKRSMKRGESGAAFSHEKERRQIGFHMVRRLGSFNETMNIYTYIYTHTHCVYECVLIKKGSII